MKPNEDPLPTCPCGNCGKSAIMSKTSRFPDRVESEYVCYNCNNVFTIIDWIKY